MTKQEEVDWGLRNLISKWTNEDGAKYLYDFSRAIRDFLKSGRGVDMRTIETNAKVIQKPPQVVKCPVCSYSMSTYDMMPRLEIDFDDIAKRLDKISERFPSHSGDVLQIVITINQNDNDRIFGHPVVYRS